MLRYKTEKENYMPNCRECGSRISKFDRDICPVCGCRFPLEGSNSETADITSQIDISSSEFKQYKPHKRMNAFLLSLFLGWSGASLFYLGYLKAAFMWLFVNLILIVGIGSLFAFILHFNVYVSFFAIAFVIVFILNAFFGLFFLFKNDLKDSKGEFLK